MVGWSRANIGHYVFSRGPLFSKVSCLQEGEGGRGECHHGCGPHQDLQSFADLQTDPSPYRIPAPGTLKKIIVNNISLLIKFETIRASARELYIWVYCVAMFVIIFGTVMYYAERWGGMVTSDNECVKIMFRMLENNPNNSFVSIPHSMWWAVVTMCTVGG